MRAGWTRRYAVLAGVAAICLTVLGLVLVNGSSSGQSSPFALIGESLLHSGLAHRERSSAGLWERYQGSDAPGGGFLGEAPDASSVSTTISLPHEVKPGSYRVFVKAIWYRRASTLRLSLGGASATAAPSGYSPVTGYWSNGIPLDVGSPSRQLQLSLTAPGKSSRGLVKILLMGLYITPAPHAAVLASDTVVDLSYSTAHGTGATDPGNLVQDGSFETGIGAGWGLTPNRSVSVMSVWDPHQGHDGQASVRLPLDQSAHKHGQFGLISRIYQVVPGEHYTLSAWVHTDPGTRASVRLALIDAFADLSRVPPGFRRPPRLIRGFRVGSSWQQISVSGVLPSYPTADYQIEILGENRARGHLSIDAVSLTQGSRALRRFTPAAPLEVGLIGEAPGNVYYADQPVRFELRAANGTARPERGVVRYEVYDYLNRTVAGGSLPVAAGAHDTAVSSLDLSSVRRTGSFRVVLWVDGESSSQEEFEYGVVPRPQRAGADPGSSIGVSSAFLPFQYQVLTRLGIKWDRAMSPAALFRWSLVEPQPGHFVWHDAEVDNASRAGISIMGTLGVQAPAWAQSGGLPNLGSWQAYVTAVVSHYRGRVQAWEVWNEPQYEFAPQFYAELLGRAMVAIHAADPSAQVVAMGGVSTPQYISQVMATVNANFPGWRSDINAFSIHRYPGVQIVNRRCSDRAQALAQAGQADGVSVWNTETGAWDNGFFQTEDAPFAAFGTSLLPYRTAAQFANASTRSISGMAQNFLQTLGSGMRKWFYYDSRIAAAPNYVLPHPTIWEYDDTIRPKGIALAVLAHFFDHAQSLGEIQLASRDVSAYLFERGGTPVVGLFSCDGSQRAITLAGPASGHVVAYDTMGNRLPTSGSTIVFGSLPVYVTAAGIGADALRTAFEQAAIKPDRDTTPPALTIDVGPQGSVTSSPPIEFRWSALDPGFWPSDATPDALSYSYRLLAAGRPARWSAWSGVSDIFVSSLRSGSYTFEVRARDLAGNVSTVASRAFTVVPG